MVFAEITVRIAVGWNRHAYARGQQTVRLVGGIFGHDGEDDFTWVQKLQSLGAGDQFSLWRGKKKKTKQNFFPPGRDPPAPPQKNKKGPRVLCPPPGTKN